MSAVTSSPMPVTDWEFLLQKEGDRSWLPLDSPSVEILEGRYRVVARSGRPQTPVEIRVTHLATNETPPKRRAQKRPGRTNADGLMVVTPYTAMQPGLWELSCFSDVMTDLSGDGWRHSVRLQVLPRDAEADDWAPDWHQSALPPSNPAEPPIAAELPPIANPWFEEADYLSEAIANDVVGEFEATVEAAPELAPPAARPVAPPTPTPETDLANPLQVVLHQASYVIHRGGKLQLSGQVVAHESPWTKGLPAATCMISLRDPQSSQVLLHHHEIMSAQALPATFTWELLLPLELSTRLMLGEITLSADRSPSPLLASQTFIVVSALNELLETIADTAVLAEDHFDLSDDPNLAHPGLNLTFLDTVNPPKLPLEKTYGSIAGQILPPQLYQPVVPVEPSKKSLDLPSFAPVPLRDVPPELSAASAPEPPAPTADSPLSADRLELALPLEPPDENSPAPPLLQLSAAQTYPIQDEFQALKLQDRFLDRLNALATDAELSAELKAQMPPAERLTVPLEESAADVTLDAQAEWLAREVVVDDPAELAHRADPHRARPTLTDTLPPEMLLPEHQDVPVPVLMLSHQTLVAGQALTVQVKIPNLLPRFYVKLWINDRQTRTLLEGPRWLVDFTPDGLGEQIAITELTVPFGSVEVVIAAIAVEMSTQRESHKVILDLPVIPSEMPDSANLGGIEF